MKFDFTKNTRLQKQLDFIVEIDKIKNIYRQSLLFDKSRFENDAEHSWTIAVMATLLREYANFTVNIEKVVLMLLLHDIVEVDAGDTYIYAANRAEAHEKEVKAANRIFGLLEDDQKELYIDLWNEFEEQKTNEAKFATVFDRLEPLLQNYLTEGESWKKHGISYEMVYKANKHIEEGSREIWDFVSAMLDSAVEKGYLPRDTFS